MVIIQDVVVGLPKRASLLDVANHIANRRFNGYFIRTVITEICEPTATTAALEIAGNLHYLLQREKAGYLSDKSQGGL